MMQSHKSIWIQRTDKLEETIEYLQGLKSNTIKEDELFEAVDKLKVVLADMKGICIDCLIDDEEEVKLIDVSDDRLCPVCYPEDHDDECQCEGCLESHESDCRCDGCADGRANLADDMRKAC